MRKPKTSLAVTVCSNWLHLSLVCQTTGTVPQKLFRRQNIRDTIIRCTIIIIYRTKYVNMYSVHQCAVYCAMCCCCSYIFVKYFDKKYALLPTSSSGVKPVMPFWPTNAQTSRKPSIRMNELPSPSSISFAGLSSLHSRLQLHVAIASNRRRQIEIEYIN